MVAVEPVGPKARKEGLSGAKAAAMFACRNPAAVAESASVVVADMRVAAPVRIVAAIQIVAELEQSLRPAPSAPSSKLIRITRAAIFRFS